jgi:hypothetical protein
MKNEITTMPVNDIMIMAKTFVDSGMFADTKQAAQAFVKIQAGQEIGLAPFASMSGINIILGKPTFGSGVIASCVKGSNKYDFKVKELSDKLCSIDFFEGKELIGNSTFTIEDAKKQSTKNLDKFPKNMLYARAISNGQKWFCPDVFQMSVYVPEEMPEPITEDVQHIEIIPVATDKQIEKLLTTADSSRISNVLNAIEEGKLEATQKQVLDLENKLKELKNGVE